MEWMSHPIVNLSLLCIAVIACGVCFALWYRLKDQQLQLDALDRFVRKELSVMSQSQIIIGKRLIYVERLKVNGDNVSNKNSKQVQQEDTSDFQEKLHSGSYNSALNLLKQGMSSDDVAKRCGLSKAETSLMQLVNRESPVG